MNNFLRMKADDEFLQAVIDKCHIDRMREDKLPYEWEDKLHYMKGWFVC